MNAQTFIITELTGYKEDDEDEIDDNNAEEH